MVICLESGANDMHMVELMPLPPHHLLLQSNPEWFTFLVPAYPGCPGKRLLNVCMYVYVCCMPQKEMAVLGGNMNGNVGSSNVGCNGMHGGFGTEIGMQMG